MKTNGEDLRKKRFYKVKKATRNFICPLCSSPREMRYDKQLSQKHFVQIFILSGSLAWLLFSWMGIKALSLFFVVWIVFEVVNKMLYRKEIPCPYCGFDATWYRRDVRVARKKVEEFWKNQKLPTSPSAEQKITMSENQSTDISDVPRVNPKVFTQENAENVLKNTIGSSM